MKIPLGERQAARTSSGMGTYEEIRKVFVRPTERVYRGSRIKTAKICGFTENRLIERSQLPQHAQRETEREKGNKKQKTTVLPIVAIRPKPWASNAYQLKSIQNYLIHSHFQSRNKVFHTHSFPVTTEHQSQPTKLRIQNTFENREPRGNSPLRKYYQKEIKKNAGKALLDRPTETNLTTREKRPPISNMNENERQWKIKQPETRKGKKELITTTMKYETKNISERTSLQKKNKQTKKTDETREKSEQIQPLPIRRDFFRTNVNVRR